MPKHPLLLDVRKLHVSVAGKDVVRGIDLQIRDGEIHAIMGPNGSGKSSFVHALMGHPAFKTNSGKALFQGKNLLSLDPTERAVRGLFLAFQYPREIAGVTLRSVLFAAFKTQSAARNPEKKVLSPVKFQVFLEEKMRELHMDPTFAERSLNQGFSGGEKKKAETLQMAVLQPRLALLDETDSGLDIDALRVVAEGVNRMRSPAFSAVIVTHYARLLEYVKPDRVHVMVRGKIVRSGGAELAYELEKEGYRKYGVTEEGQIPLE
ncbi:MAG: Fe-S cluster assembly ATPase SufC [Candidatus Peribacteraceae bacterium]